MSFDLYADQYNRSSQIQRDWGFKIINEMQISGHESILDIGCGDGLLTEILADSVKQGRAVGIDTSSRMITIAKKIKKDNLYFEKMDISKMKFNEEFHIIFSNATLHWLLDHKKLLINCYKALFKDGIIRFNFAGDGNCSNFINIVQQCMLEKQFKKYFDLFIWPWHMPTIKDYTDFIKITNYRQIKVWKENKDKYFQDQESLIKWIDQPSLIPFISPIKHEADRIAFRNLVIDKMIDKTKQDNNTFFETFSCINVFAIK